jgi:hypothetical protein
VASTTSVGFVRFVGGQDQRASAAARGDFGRRRVPGATRGAGRLERQAIHERLHMYGAQRVCVGLGVEAFQHDALALRTAIPIQFGAQPARVLNGQQVARSPHEARQLGQGMRFEPADDLG